MRKPKIRDLKSQARLLLNGKYSFMALITAFMAFANVGLNYLLVHAVPAAPGILGLVLYFATLVLCNMVYCILQAGMIRIYLNLARGASFRFSDLFSAFSNHPEPIAVYAVVQLLLQTGLFYCFDRLLEAFRYFVHGAAIPLIPFILILLLGAVLIWMMLHFSLVIFLHCDGPWKTTWKLLTESWNLTSGNMGRQFYLLLSFIGVGILCLISLGIGFLFAFPYLHVTQTLFYLNLLRSAPNEAENRTASHV